MIQIIIGTTVSEVYDEMLELMEKETGTKETGMEKADPTGGKKDIFSRLFEILSGIFTPTIPAVAGTALVSALLSLMRTFNLVSRIPCQVSCASFAPLCAHLIWYLRRIIPIRSSTSL